MERPFFPWGLCRGVILKTIGATAQFAGGDRRGEFSAGDDTGGRIVDYLSVWHVLV
jgi:hypothetical protein